MAVPVVWCPTPRRVIGLLSLAVGCAGCGDAAGPADREPVGLMVAGGQNAAFPGDTFALHTWLTDSAGSPLGIRPTEVRWASSDPSVVESVSDSLFVARDLGTTVLSAEVAVDGSTFQASREFRVLPPLTGRMVWVRASDLATPARLVSEDVPDGAVIPAPALGNANAPHGLPALSPDGRYAAVQAPRPPSDVADVAVYVVDLVTDSVLAVTESMPGNQISPRWSPDGQLVFFSSDANGRWDVWSVPRTGGQAQVRVTLNAGLPVFLDVTPGGDRAVVALVTPEGGADLWEARLDVGIERRITNTPTAGKGNPRISPNGESIVYSGPVGPDQPASVFVLPWGGGVARELVTPVLTPHEATASTRSTGAEVGAHSWSPDGQFLLIAWHVDATAIFTSGEIRQWLTPGDIYAVSADGLWRIRLTTWKWADVQADLR